MKNRRNFVKCTNNEIGGGRSSGVLLKYLILVIYYGLFVVVFYYVSNFVGVCKMETRKKKHKRERCQYNQSPCV